MRLLLSTILLIFLSLPAMAEEYVYAPEGCDFEMTFPEEPHTIRRCHEKVPDKCTLMHNYTKVFGVDATVNFYVSCTQTTQNLREEYSPDVMRTTLLARPGVDDLEVYDISHDSSDNATTAALIGAGKTPNGKDVMIYVAQLWIGDNSIFTVEGELIGHGVEEADFLFADIMKTLHHKDNPLPEKTENKTGDSDVPQEEDTPEKDESTEKNEKADSSEKQ